jgi:hypothetical protein
MDWIVVSSGLKVMDLRHWANAQRVGAAAPN